MISKVCPVLAFLDVLAKTLALLLRGSRENIWGMVHKPGSWLGSAY